MKKKYVIPFAVLLSVASLAGCGKKDENPYSKYVTLGEYTGMTVDRIVTTISDDDVQNEIQNDLYADADFKEVTDRGAKEGDTVNIDYTGTIDGYYRYFPGRIRWNSRRADRSLLRYGKFHL